MAAMYIAFLISAVFFFAALAEKFMTPRQLRTNTLTARHLGAHHRVRDARHKSHH